MFTGIITVSSVYCTLFGYSLTSLLHSSSTVKPMHYILNSLFSKSINCFIHRIISFILHSVNHISHSLCRYPELSSLWKTSVVLLDWCNMSLVPQGTSVLFHVSLKSEMRRVHCTQRLFLFHCLFIKDCLLGY